MARSKLEDELDAALAVLYPTDSILSDMPIKVPGTTLYVDRVIKRIKLAVEADGRQHSAFVEHFHKDRQGFENSKRRDADKERWLFENGYTLVRFGAREKITAESLKRKIIAAYS